MARNARKSTESCENNSYYSAFGFCTWYLFLPFFKSSFFRFFRSFSLLFSSFLSFSLFPCSFFLLHLFLFSLSFFNFLFHFLRENLFLLFLLTGIYFFFKSIFLFAHLFDKVTLQVFSLEHSLVVLFLLLLQLLFKN